LVRNKKRERWGRERVTETRSREVKNAKVKINGGTAKLEGAPHHEKMVSEDPDLITKLGGGSIKNEKSSNKGN